MSYIDQVLERLHVPGLLLLVVGAVAVYASGFIADRLKGPRDRIELTIKMVGCAGAVVGALMLLDVIG